MEHIDKLINVENEWSDSIDASKVDGAVRRIEVEEVQCAMTCIKMGSLGLLYNCLRMVEISV